MTEPASAATAATAAALTTATAVTTLLPGIDGNALVGAIAGAALYVTSARDLPLIRRGIYLAISTAVGYLGADTVEAYLPVHSSGVAAFLAGALAITLATQAIERLSSMDLSSLITKRGA